MELKEKFWTLVLVLVFLFVNYHAVLQVIKMNQWMEEKKYCGRVENIDTQLESVKHGTRTDYYLVVNLDGVGSKAIEVTPQTFYTTKPGQRVCFDLSHQFVYGRGEGDFLGVASLVVSVIVDIILIIALCFWLVEGINRLLDKIEIITKSK